MKMKIEFAKHNLMLEEQAVACTQELICEMLMELGNIYEDVDHYPTLPDTVEELAELLELDIDTAYEETILILEEIVLDNRRRMNEQLRWSDLQSRWSDNFN
jgi:hypothetical protein